ncbi:hypothetical protein IU433_25810 [Nocardia puris]|uniref:Peptidase inhibitor family I36 n=1 Tax=Nocardia puris TaxID=208602 RepID=A0A366E3R3_9NOCA|nr:hypothetical protein [Nocardia puris]MBF6214675.1 hypothetical protein [Nocardia puris]MBF6368851.1 hypothetical protein [Nocardia puris]MBF6462431.1 hypothetical protein [Nocardia puris]RBO97011.1 hypothetical protein DFR74_1011030 [Nocardia puris]
MRASTLLIAGAMASAATLLGAGTAAAQPATVMPGDGLYLVGVDIFPGVWESPGTPDPAYGCDWRRLWKVEGDNTNMNYIIGNNFTRLAPVRVVIKPTDVAFKTENCGAWRMLPPPPSTGSAGF